MVTHRAITQPVPQFCQKTTSLKIVTDYNLVDNQQSIS